MVKKMVKKLSLGQSAALSAMAARSDMSIEGLRRTFRDHLFYTQGRFLEGLEGPGKNDLYMALSYTVRDQLMHRWIKTVDQIVQRLSREDVKVVAYLSAEFLLGPHLENNMINLGIYEVIRRTAEGEGLDIQTLFDQEAEPGLGNGGLGRLAACYLDSLATLEVPAIGRYPLRIRPLRAGDSRRLAGGAHRQLASIGQSMGSGST